VASRPFQYLKAALLMPANLFALAAGGVASAVAHSPTPLIAAAGASLAYLTLLSTAPGFRRMVRASSSFDDDEIASPELLEKLLAELAPSQLEHYEQLRALRDRILINYQQMPGGRVLAASSQSRLDALLTSFVRLVGTLNTYRKYLGSADRRTLEMELEALQKEVDEEPNPRLKEVKQRRAEILKKRVSRFQQAEESRELVSHQLASIEDVLKLTHEQSIAIRDPDTVARQLESLTGEVEATEQTVKEMERFMEFSDEIQPSLPHGERVR
jgi:hypothetical protein